MASFSFSRMISGLGVCAVLATGAQAEKIEAPISAVRDGHTVEIRLPEGAMVAPGDTVRILAEIPGLGLTAIDTSWQVESITGSVVWARPVEPPSGTPQVGYVARIDTQASQDGTADASTTATSNLRSSASDRGLTEANPGSNVPLSPDHPMVENVPVSEQAEAFYARGVELFRSDDPLEIASGMDHLSRAATMRHAEAMTTVGAAFSFGRGVETDHEVALSWQQNAAKIGNALAMLRLGLIYETGWGVPIDRARGLAWFNKAADMGDARAMLIVALFYEEGFETGGEDLTEMILWLEKSAAAGEALAMYILGDIYLDGEDGVIAADPAKALNYRTRAAEIGFIPAMDEVSNYWEGLDDESALMWHRRAKAAKERDRDWRWTENPGCLSSWECYDPERQSEGSGLMLLDNTLPADANGTRTVDLNAPGRTVRVMYEKQPCDTLAASPSDPDLPDPSWAVEFADMDATRAIEACLADIAHWPDTRRFYTQLGSAYFKTGQYQDAFRQLEIGAEMGSSQSMALIAVMYKIGRGVVEDKVKALELFERAAFDGNVSAMHFAAGMHLKAEGVPYNPKAAAEWWQAAADQGDGEAMGNLGILFDNGQGVPYDPNEAADNLLASLAMNAQRAQRALLEEYDQLSAQTRVNVQRRLRADGLYFGELDGKFGPQTLQALQTKIMN